MKKKITAVIASIMALTTITPVAAFAGGAYSEDWQIKAIYNFGETTYYPYYGEGWDEIYENTGCTRDEIIAYNGWDEDAEPLYGVPLYMPTRVQGDFSGCDRIENPDYEESDDAWYSWGDESEEGSSTWWGAEEIIGEQTLYNDPNSEAWHNIRRAAEILDGVEVENGDTFSFYEQFPNQGGYEDGMIESNYFIDENTIGRTVGAGLCFPSTVTAQSADNAEGMEVVERWAHVQDVGYAIRGVNDAAVNLSVDPAYRQDLKIYNNTGQRVRFNYYLDDYTGAFTCIITKLSEFFK